MAENRAVYRVGMGGWEHEVFDGCFYDRPSMSSAEKLRFYARYFQAVEVRATFWDDALGAEDAREWAAAVQEAPAFQFAVKLHSTFTHGKTLRPDLTKTVREALHVLARQNRLGSLLVQFPYAFTNTGAHRIHIAKIAEAFAGFPLHVEFRHQSWNQEGTLAFLRERSLGIVAADMPRIRQYMPFITAVSGESAYIRLHGRNEKGWMLDGYDARYDYQYNSREVREISRRLRGLSDRCRRVLLVCNNTTGGKSVPAALQILSALRDGDTVPVPPRALAAFPFLRGIASDANAEMTLLGDDYRRAI